MRWPALLIPLAVVATDASPVWSQTSADADAGVASGSTASSAAVFRPADVFDLEYAADPTISPDGRPVVYVRRSNDIMEDRTRSALWILSFDGSMHRPLVAGEHDASSPHWSPDGGRLLYVSSRGDDGAELYIRWMDTGQEAKLSQLEYSPGGIVWSPDGRWIAFTMFVPEEREPLAQMPPKPEGAEWAEPARVFRDVLYRRDGQGYVEPGHRQIFVLPAEGGTPRQLTFGPYDHGSPVWAPDGGSLLFSANRRENAALEPLNSEIYEVSIEADPAEPRVRALTDRYGRTETRPSRRTAGSSPTPVSTTGTRATRSPCSTSWTATAATRV